MVSTKKAIRYHEAGHVVMARAVGIKVISVSAKDRGCVFKANFTLAEMLCIGDIRWNTRACDNILDMIAVLLSGAQAHRLLAGISFAEAIEAGGISDYHESLKLTGPLTENCRSPGWEFAKANAKMTLQARWDQVEALAQWLRTHDFLTGREVERILAKVDK